MNRQIDEEDDGRVIADMGTVRKRNLFLPRSLSESEKNEKPEYLFQRQKKNTFDDGMTREESRWVMLGALKAAFLIWLVYAVVFGLFILLLTLLN